MALVTNVVKGSEADRVLLLLHGFGADERDLGGLLPYLDPDGAFVTVMPRGPTAAGNGFAWYDVAESDSETQSGAVAGALESLDGLLDQSCAEHGARRDESVVAGFSQGGGLALALGLRPSDRPHPAGVIGMSPASNVIDLDGSSSGAGVAIDWEAARDVAVLVQHGTDDPLIPVQRSRELAAQLSSHGVPTVYGEYPMAHQVAIESLQQARAWLTSLRAGEKPSESLPEPPPESPVRPVTTAEFQTEVLGSDVPVIVDFWAPWCGPCRQVSPIVEQIAVMREGSYKVVKVNIDEEPGLAQQYGVESIPLIGLFRNGRLERVSIGAKPRPQLEAELGMLVIP